MENIENVSTRYIDDIQRNSNDNYEHLKKFSNGGIELTDIAKEAHFIVDEVIKNSSKHLLENNEQVSDISWLTLKDFSIENGINKIHEFIKTWDRKPNWLYCVDFLSEEEKEFSKRFRYRVKWSIPTRRKPVPRATACVYFTFDASTVKPKDSLVGVYFIFESSKLVHRPGHSRFREKWLKDVIDAKVSLTEAITF